MSKKFALISLAIIAIFGSIFTFYATNLFFGDVSCYFSNTTIFITFAALCFGALLLAAPLFLVRFYQREKSRKALCKHYLFIALALGTLGLIFVILAAIIDMHSLFKPYPFPGYLVIMLIIYLVIIGGSLFTLFKIVFKMPEDEEKFKMTAKHVFHTIGLYLLTALAFNRFGAFLFMPLYVQWSTFNRTFVYYLFLLIPMALLVIKMIDMFKIRHNMFIEVFVISTLNIILMIAILFFGMNDSSFISAVSAAAPLERLGSMPMEIFIHFFAYFIVTQVYFLRTRKQSKVDKLEAQEQKN